MSPNDERIVIPELQDAILAHLYVQGNSNPEPAAYDIVVLKDMMDVSDRAMHWNVHLLCNDGLASVYGYWRSLTLTPAGVSDVEQRRLVTDDEVELRREARQSIMSVLAHGHELGHLDEGVELVIREAGVSQAVFTREFQFLRWRGHIDAQTLGNVNITTLGYQEFKARPLRWDDRMSLVCSIDSLQKLDGHHLLAPAEIERLTHIPLPRLSHWMKDGKLPVIQDEGRRCTTVASLLSVLREKLTPRKP